MTWDDSKRLDKEYDDCSVGVNGGYGSNSGNSGNNGNNDNRNSNDDNNNNNDDNDDNNDSNGTTHAEGGAPKSGGRRFDPECYDDRPFYSMLLKVTYLRRLILIASCDDLSTDNHDEW